MDIFILSLIMLKLDERVSPSGVVSTYTLAYTTANAYTGGVLSSDGDIYCIPGDAQVGQIISAYGNVSTYSLLYTTNRFLLWWCFISHNGDIHFIPLNSSYGQQSFIFWNCFNIFIDIYYSI